ncbi:MAG: ABC transporter permease subunit [Bacteriovoracaceae bacterium]|jgi:membrane protease YdiL (CAAX protease family)|nr:ABC transporter permease subunit [Bacteriovoracaceae bacterium]
MISIRNIKTIFKKEFLQIMRDKSVLFTNFFVPLFGLPIYMIFIIEASVYVVNKKDVPLKDDTIFKISYQGDFESNLIKRFKNDKKIKLTKVGSSLKEKDIITYRDKFRIYKKLKRKKKNIKDKFKLKKKNLKEQSNELSEAREEYHHALEVLKKQHSKKFDLHIAIFKNKAGYYAAYFFHSEINTVASAAQNYSEALIEKFESEQLSILLKKKKLQDHHLNPYSFWKVNIDKQASKSLKVIGIAMGSGILFLLLISIFNASINTTIGERDQNTFKVLLMNPISLHEIFMGKYLNVSLQGILTLIPYSIEAIIFYAWGKSHYIFDDVPEITTARLFFLTVGTISTAMLVSSMCFLTSSFAKSRVQAQSLITLLIIFIAIPLGIIGIMDIKLTSMSAFLPLVNFPMSTENLITLSPDYFSISLAIMCNIITSMILIWFSLGAFQIQWKGKSDTQSLSDLLSTKRRKSKMLVPAHAYFSFAIAFLGFVYGGTIISVFNINLISHVFSPIIFCLGTALFIIYYSGLDFTTLFKWKGLDFLYGIRLAAGAFCLSLAIQLILANSVVSEVFKSAFPDLLGDEFFSSNVGNFFIFAVIPGFTEEVLFRGIIFKGLRNQYSFLISMIISSLFFSIVHLSMFRLGHTLIAGLLLAYIYEHKGLLSAMFFHLAFNSYGIYFGQNESINSFINDTSTVEKFALVPLLTLLVLILVLFRTGFTKEKLSI